MVRASSSSNMRNEYYAKRARGKMFVYEREVRRDGPLTCKRFKKPEPSKRAR